MLDFEYYGPTRIIFGRESLGGLAAQMQKVNPKKLLLVYDGNPATMPIVDQVKEVLNGGGVTYTEFFGIKSNPLLSKVMEGIELGRKENIDFLLAVGGGSVIDTAKGIAAGLKLKDGEDIWRDYYFPKNRFNDALPMGVVLTIPASGSEASFGTVLTHDELLTKRYTGGESLIPKFAILNPEFTMSLPPYQTASGVFDIVSHLIERYFVNFPHVDLSDRMIEACIRTMLNTAPILVDDPTNYDARAEVMWAGCIAHNKILEMGRTHGDWASHDIAHELSAMYEISHGGSLAVIMPSWMRYVYKHNIPKFHQFACRVFDVDVAYNQIDDVINTMIERLEDFIHTMGLPTKLKGAGIGNNDFELLASNAMEGRKYLGTGNGIILLGKEDILEILKMAEK